ncbi:MAG: CHASE2 domain-containing protein [Phycisphaerales bacterium]|nr:CHASE2 domain-containing protein [Phycisphaerales bacterium]
MSRQQRREVMRAAALGFVATLLAVALSVTGGLDWLELKSLDLRFRYANRTPQHPDLVGIDIDDAAIEKVGRWPWPRDVQAGVLGVLAEAGLRALLVDITLSEPETIRTITPELADVAFDPLALAQAGHLAVALPDLEIRAALRDSGAAYLAFDYSNGKNWRDVLDSAALAEAVALLRARRPEAAETLLRGVRKPAGWDGGAIQWDPLLWARLIAALRDVPTMDTEAACAAVPDGRRPQLELALEACREVALRQFVDQWLSGDPARLALPPAERFDALLAALGPAGRSHQSAIGHALRFELSRRATLAAAEPALQAFADHVAEVLSIAPVYFEHASAARRCGFVVFEPDGDGVVRRMRLLARHQGQVLPQLAFALAHDELTRHGYAAEVTPRRVTYCGPGDDRRLSVQLDARGNAIIPWVAEPDWTRQFVPRVPVALAWQVFDRRARVRQNREAALDAAGGLRGTAGAEPLAQLAEDLATLRKLEDAWRLARYRDDRPRSEALASQLTEAERYLAESEAAVQSWLSASGTAATQEGNSLPPPASRVLADALAANAAYRREIDATLARLRGALGGKIGLLGYTATALADMAPIPTHRRAPGVLAHANLLNGLLVGRTVSWAPAWLNALLTALLGALASYLTARVGPRCLGVLAAALAAYLALAGWAAFYFYLYWLHLVAPAAALLLSYFAVTVFRYAFLERERRQLATALGQYTSATLARRMAEDPELCKRAETREVTAMFTDLAGFTTLSERIGAERTQRVLNVSLGRLSDAILRHEGMINKFIGDGVFAFWNPVIYPQPDHAARACRAALELFAALDHLARDPARRDEEAYGQLHLRVGVATGSAVVGPCGSEQKYDYTCIGDSVNVASRLESANKFFGTRILISAATHDAVRPNFLVRPLGSVQVKGKTRGVGVYELLGLAGQVDAADVNYAHAFEQAVGCFCRREFTAALERFGACLSERPSDRAAQHYMDLCRAYLAEPPDDRWAGVIELSEK